MKEKAKYHIGYIISLIIAVGLIITIGLQYSSMDSTIPIHYNFYGYIDRFGDKIEITNLCFISLLIPCFFYCIESTPQYLKLAIFPKEKKETVETVLHYILMWLSFLVECFIVILYYASITKQNLPRPLLIMCFLFYVILNIATYCYFRYLRKAKN